MAERDAPPKPGDAMLVQVAALEGLAALAEQRWPTYRFWAEPGAGGLGPDDAALVSVLIAPSGADRLPRLRLMAGLAAGYEGIDLRAAGERNIAISNVALANNDDMAD
jgi:phosphoglycerate dehydrogenase-like enzyme